MTTTSEVYTYRGSVARVIDGDTMEINIDLGFHISVRRTFRLYGINTAEKISGEAGEPGKKAENFVRELVEGKAVIVQTFRDKLEKYGRYLAEVFAVGDNFSVNKRLLAAGLAVEYMGGKRT